MQVWHILLIITIILAAALVVLYFLGKRMQKRQAEQQEQIEQSKQTVSLLVIDKKRMRITEAGLPQAVIDSVPKLMRRSKVPVVKVKYGPKIMTMIADDKIFDDIPVKREVKAVVSGIYITDVKVAHGKPVAKPEEKKKGIRARLRNLGNRAQSRLNESEKSSTKKK